MPLASEDRPFLRDLLHEIRDVQRETNVLLEEIRDLLKSPPVTIEGRPLTRGVGGTLIDAREAGECLRNLGDRPAPESTLKPGDTFSTRSGRDLPKSPTLSGFIEFNTINIFSGRPRSVTTIRILTGETT